VTKDWISYLSAAFRLVDLHDSARSFGSTLTSLKEERTGRRDGVWLHLACDLLSYLDECDLETNEGWNPIGPFVKDICGRHRSLNDEDVQLVISYLATPTEVYFIKEEPTNGRAGTQFIWRRYPAISSPLPGTSCRSGICFGKPDFEVVGC